MKEPMELSASSRSLLDAARDGLGPDAATIARMRGKIGAAVATGAATGGAAGATLATKLGILGLVVAVGVGAAVIATRGDDEPARIASEPTEVSAPHTQIATREAPAPAVAPNTAPETEPPTIEMPAIARNAPTAPTPAPKVAPPKAEKPARADLKREVELVDRAMVALRAGDLAAALAAVRVHAAETGGAGQLAEDAAAIEVDVLCKKKDATAQQRLAAFDARWPRSAQRAKLCR